MVYPTDDFPDRHSTAKTYPKLYYEIVNYYVKITVTMVSITIVRCFWSGEVTDMNVPFPFSQPTPWP